MKKIALYPGCFDPIHKQHIAIVKQLLKEFVFLDEIWILLNANSEEKKIIAPFEVRHKMIKEVLPVNSRLRIYDQPINFYTTELIKELQSKNPSFAFYLVLGSDQINKLPTWNKAEDLPKLVRFICAPRLTFAPDSNVIKKYQVLMLQKLNLNNINSSMIKKGQNWEWLDFKTIKHILDYKIYFSHFLKQQIKNSARIAHSYRVADLAIELNERFDLKCNKNDLYIASLLHDITKKWTREQHLSFLKKHHLSTNIIQRWPFNIWHAYTGAFFVQKELKINKPIIFQAIKYHSTAYFNFSHLGKIVFIADKLEPQKKDQFFKKAKQLLKKTDCNFNQLFQNTVIALFYKLQKQNKKPTYATFKTYKKFFK